MTPENPGNPNRPTSSDVPSREHVPSGDPHPVDSMLISYLDGELDDPASAELESRLAEDPDLRNRLHEFQRTWDMLDEVTRINENATLVKSTMEMVVSSAKRKRRRWHRWPLKVVLGTVAVVLPAVLAFQSVRYVQTGPWRQFVAELQYWENADMYDKVDSIEFAEQLHGAGLFDEELPNEP